MASPYEILMDARSEVSGFFPEALREAIRLAKLARDEVDAVAATYDRQAVDWRYDVANRLAFAQAAAAASRAMAAAADLEERRTLTYGPEQ